MHDSNAAGNIHESANPTSAADCATQGSGERLNQGFEMIFGDVLERQRRALDRIEAETRERFEGIERDAGHQAQILALLKQRAEATHEREDGELRRRRLVEGDLRESLSQLAQTVKAGFDDLRQRADDLEQQTASQLAQLQEARGGARERRDLELLRSLVVQLEATKFDRVELAKLLARFSRELAAADAAERAA